MAITQNYVDFGTGNDYTGASFTDGAFANASLTLTKAGAFAAASVGHWYYLTDNGSGEVTAGYYRVTDVTGAPNAVVLHADIRSGANDPTDVKCTQADGTALLPYRSLQGAFDLLTRNAADGNQVNLKAGTAHVNDAALDLDEVIAGGALAAVGPLIVRGYTAAANDGGVGEIDCGGATMWAAATYNYVILADLEIHTFGNNNGIASDTNNILFRCEVHKGASSPSGKYLITLTNNAIVYGCYVHDPGGGAARCIHGTSGMRAVANYVDMGASATGGYGIYNGVSAGQVIGNIVKCGHTGQNGIYAVGGPIVTQNAVYNSAAGTGNGIEVIASSILGLIANNIISGWSGVGGDGINVAADIGWIGYNAFYNCTNPNTIADMKFLDLTASDVTLAADPFTNAGTGDFSLTAAGKTALRGLGWPAAYLGAHANTDGHITIGAVQYGEAEATATANLLRGKL